MRWLYSTHLFCSISTRRFTSWVLSAFGWSVKFCPGSCPQALFGYTTMVYSFLGLFFLGFDRLAHHMFTSGRPPWMPPVFHDCRRPSIAVPTGINSLTGSPQTLGGKIRTEQRHVFPAVLHRFTSYFVHHRGGTGPGPLRIFMFARHLLRCRAIFTTSSMAEPSSSCLDRFINWFSPSSRAGCLNEQPGAAALCAQPSLVFTSAFCPLSYMAWPHGMPRRVAEYDPAVSRMLKPGQASVGALRWRISPFHS